MSKQAGLVKFTGKMGDISFYEKNGVHMARIANGPKKARIMSDPRFARTRENISEFGGLALATSSFVRLFAAVKRIKDGNLRSRVSKVMNTLIKSSIGVRGQRGVDLSTQRSVLMNIEISSTQMFASLFAARSTATFTADRKTATFTADNVIVHETISAPESATHFQIVQLLGIISDTAYNAAASKFEPLQPEANGVNELSATEYLPLSGNAPLSIALTTTLPAALALSERVSVIQAVGILFFEQIGTTNYPLNQGQAMKIINVF